MVGRLLWHWIGWGGAFYEFVCGLTLQCMLSAFEIEWGSRCDEDWIDIIDIILLNYLTISLGVVGSYVVYSPVVRV